MTEQAPEKKVPRLAADESSRRFEFSGEPISVLGKGRAIQTAEPPVAKKLRYYESPESAMETDTEPAYMTADEPPNSLNLSTPAPSEEAMTLSSDTEAPSFAATSQDAFIRRVESDKMAYRQTLLEEEEELRKQYFNYDEGPSFVRFTEMDNEDDEEDEERPQFLRAIDLDGHEIDNDDPLAGVDF
ncbi:hypothetical protein BDR06DRAFT_1006650 [Suillus hirtellus]|nr:hypothetical protein BDR06DRAFT_1006650 [Suillus hirtellus]